MATLEDLLAQRAALDLEIERKRKERTAEALSGLRAHIASYQRTLSDLAAKSLAGPAPRQRKSQPA